MALCPVCGRPTSIWTRDTNTGRCPSCQKAGRTLGKNERRCNHCNGTTYCGGHWGDGGNLKFDPACVTCKSKSGLPPEKDAEKVVCSVCQGKGCVAETTTQTQAPSAKQDGTDILKGLVALIIIGAIAWFTRGFWMKLIADHKAGTTALSGQQSPSLPLSQLPGDQTQFINIVESFYQPYKEAPNELKKSALRTDRKTALEKFTPNRTVNNWIGRIKEMTTNSSGDAHIALHLEGSKAIVIKTWNNSLSDLMDGTLIIHGSPLYNNLINLSKGDLVRFSGNFFHGGNSLDFLRETSITEEGSMTEPDFIFKFTNAEKLP